jgi:hypothetical protein
MIENFLKYFNSFDSATKISLSSVSLAIAALFISVWNVVTFRRHNRLSVRPSLSILKRIWQTHPQVSIIITNNGLGPAFIKRIIIRIDGKEYPLFTVNQWKTFFQNAGISNGIITCYTMQDKETLRPGDPLTLVSIDDSDRECNVHRVVNELNNLCVEVTYYSIYEEKFIEILGKDEIVVASSSEYLGTL